MRVRFATCAGWLFVSLVLLAPSAHADLVRRAGETVQKVLAPVAPQPAPAPAPSTPPSIPRTPTPTPPSPEPPTAPSTSPVTEPVQRVTDGASSTVRSVTRPAAPQSGGTRTGSSGGSRSGGSSNGYTGAGTGGGAAADVPLAGRGRPAGHTAAGTTAGGGGAPAERRETRSSAGFGAIVGARPAIDPRFSAYVWPAIALGRAAGAVLGAVDLPLASALAPIAPQLPRILAGAAALASASSFGDPSSTAADRPRRNGPAPPLPYTPDHLPDSGELSFILLVLLCLAPLTAFAYTIVRELRQMPRWPHG